MCAVCAYGALVRALMIAKHEIVSATVLLARGACFKLNSLSLQFQSFDSIQSIKGTYPPITPTRRCARRPLFGAQKTHTKQEFWKPPFSTMCLPRGSKMTSKSIPRGASERPFSMTFPFCCKSVFWNNTRMVWLWKVGAKLHFSGPQGIEKTLKKHFVF